MTTIHRSQFLTRAGFLALLAAFGATSALAAEPLRIGVLPAADAIVLYAAADEGLFKKAGLDVEIVPFKSALELGAAMRAGRLDGHFGDLMNVFTQNETGVKQAVLLTTTHTNAEQRAFGLVIAPAKAGEITSLDVLKAKKGTETAMSSTTIIDYLADRMSETAGLPDGTLRSVEVKPIPIRLQMLLSGKVASAILPEPLVSVVESKGGRVVWDDKALNEALAVVALRSEKLDPATVSGFRGAVAEAAKLIEADPEKFRAVMVKKRLLPQPVAKDYKMVRFSIYGTADGLPPLPTEAEVKRVGEWMIKKGMLKAVPDYASIVVPACK